MTTTIRELVEPLLPPDRRLAVQVPATSPDLTVMSLGSAEAMAAREAYTVIYVSECPPPSRRVDRSPSGPPCAWQVCLQRPPGFRGPVPVIIVRLRRGLAWRERFYLRGRRSELPICVGFGAAGTPELITVPLDPGDLAPIQWLGLLPSRRR